MFLALLCSKLQLFDQAEYDVNFVRILPYLSIRLSMLRQSFSLGDLGLWFLTSFRGVGLGDRFCSVGL